MKFVKKVRPILAGIKSYFPFLSSVKGTGGTVSARYCYSVWLRHLSAVFENGLNSYPSTIAELGPGDSIGIGLAGMIGGAQRYYALDVVRHATIAHNVKVFDELVVLFEKREKIPDNNEFPGLSPRPKSYQFLSNVITDEILKESLNEKRIRRIRNELLKTNSKSLDRRSIQYVCPWFRSEIIQDESVDMIFSQAVLEHVDDLKNTYVALHRWLKKGGIMSHQIDFTSHGISDKWNGHWSYSAFVWRLIRGNRPYLLNREPLSTHISLLKNTGFKITLLLPRKDTGGLKRNELSRRYRELSEEDLTTRSVYIVSTKD